uniref:Fungal lipase-like domain-containing protein n=1 Tax=Panagrolaimus sp. PS1159 TaxID=55785 RepID=A0AC35GW03_9BILA
MSCQKCVDLYNRVKKATIASRQSTFPSVLELAYMVNLEYYIDMKYDCIHNIIESKNAKIKISEIIQFLDERHWQLGTRVADKGFKCTSFLNRPAKQLVIVHRGTELKNMPQIATDIRIATNRITPEIIAKADWHTLQSLLNNTLKFNEKTRIFERNEYSVTITGHSLGGWLAQLCTLLYKHPKFFPVGPRGTIYFENNAFLDMNRSYNLHCVAFDSPGANAILTKLKDEPGWLNGGPRDVEIALEELDITVYLANKNLVNTCGKHMKCVKKIDVMTNASRWTKLNPFASHSMEGILAYFKNNPNE